MNSQLQELHDDMLYGPEDLYIVYVVYMDNTFRFFTFSEEESQMGYVEYLAENARQMGISTIRYGDSLLDATAEDDFLFVVH